MNIIIGSHVWVEDPGIAWIDGQVSKINGQEAEIQTTDGRKVLPSYNLNKLLNFLDPHFIFIIRANCKLHP